VLSPTGSRVLDLSLAGFVVERGKGDDHGRATVVTRGLDRDRAAMRTDDPAAGVEAKST